MNNEPNVFVQLDGLLLRKDNSIHKELLGVINYLKKSGAKIYFWSERGENFVRDRLRANKLLSIADGLSNKWNWVLEEIVPDIVIDRNPNAASKYRLPKETLVMVIP